MTKIKPFSLFITLIFAVTFSNAKEVSYDFQIITSLKEMITQENLKKITPKTLVLVDLDETLLFDVKHLRRDIDPSALGGQQARLIETNAPQILTILGNPSQDLKVPVLALTKRSFRPEIPANISGFIPGHERVKELKIPLDTLTYKKYNYSYYQFHHRNYYFYNEGVIYSNGMKKDWILNTFVSMVSAPGDFDNIIMVDDKLDNLQDVESWAKQKGISMTSYLFTGADKFKRN